MLPADRLLAYVHAAGTLTYIVFLSRHFGPAWRDPAAGLAVRIALSSLSTSHEIVRELVAGTTGTLLAQFWLLWVRTQGPRTRPAAAPTRPDPVTA